MGGLVATRRCHQPPKSHKTIDSKGCGAEGVRTPDLLIANEALYQLSYDPSLAVLAA